MWFLWLLFIQTKEQESLALSRPSCRRLTAYGSFGVDIFISSVLLLCFFFGFLWNLNVADLLARQEPPVETSLGDWRCQVSSLGSFWNHTWTGTSCLAEPQMACFFMGAAGQFLSHPLSLVRFFHGQNFIYVHLNRLIKERHLSMIYTFPDRAAMVDRPLSRKFTWKVCTRNIIPTLLKTKQAWVAFSSNLVFPVAFPVMWRRKLRDPCTRVANWVIPSRMPMEPSWTSPISLWQPVSAMVKPKRVPWPPRGMPTSF